ncbi:MAG: 2,3-bisphosphoglycerate-independent phosphoglycerate mutase [Candidatus Nomurabacteria bacterium]|nr:2,3-bisphosphoglycerate-independent phosphoglycerate mutase [Candidatus Nomurabacteria bacterium]
MGGQKQKINYKGPVVLAILDGVGLSSHIVGNAVRQAYTPNLDLLMGRYPLWQLKASGEAVGVPEGQAGNSEIGHYTMGSGQVVKQNELLVDEAVKTGKIFDGQTWKDAVQGVLKNESKMHFVGIFSDGRVHSNMYHMLAMIQRASEQDVKKARVHILLDGRDVPPTSALKYVDILEEELAAYDAKGFDYKIASGGGRTYVTADRYGSDWPMVERGWQAHVLGTARPFTSARAAIETFRQEQPSIQDQYLPPFTIVGDDGAPVGKMDDGDTVIYYDFRADRAIEFSEAMTVKDFDKFERGHVPRVYYAGMVEYDRDRHIPAHTLVEPVQVKHVLAEYLVSEGISRFVTSESIKFGHVTFYFNGNKNGRFSDKLEEYVDIPNKTGEPWQFPWMDSDKLTDISIEKIKGGKFKSILVNYPNGDIVGHEAKMLPSIIAMEAVDLALGRTMAAVDEAGGVLLVTADHGNLEEEVYLGHRGGAMLKDGKPVPKTSHTTNPVPFVIYDNTENRDRYSKKSGDFGLSNIAATVALLHGLKPLPEWDEPVIELN